MKKVLFCVFAVSLFVLAGCSDASPSGIESKMLTEMKNGDYEKTIELYFEYSDIKKGEQTSEEMAELTKAFSEKAKESMEKKGGLKSFEIVSETISEDGTEAEVATKLIYGDGSEDEQTSKYVKVDDQWKLKSGK